MTIIKIHKIQVFLYLFILAFGIQHLIFYNYNFKWIFYEYIILSVFILSALTVIISPAVLIYESVKSINRKSVIVDEIIYLVVNIILYYIVVAMSLYLSSQVRM
ncbi:MAG: hypothetical protein LBE39_18085 [Flavobacteriaceae bacterium]|jgi:hypothetical protein|uniref:hypothetical protein n=1 Tax=Elizabethkingia ursingii TaxID=1756150 RepID=UPI002012F76B|nr:hypothetical protein [Elizabethkingia ursingii]MCL1672359.1 hypothetical protein [Elizabethkingia ursingii]MDR2231385.1 hypothetical protein [Flavobacteriaceae bacterium]